ncbi:MAG: DNA helicase UvrD, partial [Burkholderiales bacterium]|nr:DNA helicase UvrD [Burkholderiales bacterium]
RTHAAAYEAALQHSAIPYLGTGHGTFVECLEIQDLKHLLQCLIAPYDNLALAVALRSPIFACADSDLTLLASTRASRAWRDRLTLVAQELPVEHPLVRASRLIERWAAAADSVPVHDLLDKIYAEGNVLARYVSAAPPHLKNRVRMNLRRLLELALELDHGRYPSLMRFLNRLPVLADREHYASADTLDEHRGHVRIMTIHAAKGLEKPVVFLVDAMREASSRRGHMRALVDWSVEASRPSHFLLVSKKDDLDRKSQQLLQALNPAVRREEANLLYVALTRAKHALFISACEPGRGVGR